MDERWVNKGAFYGLKVETLGPRVTFSDLVEGEFVRVFVNYDDPRMTRFEIGNGGNVIPRLTLTRGEGLTERAVLHYATKDDCKRLRVGITIHRSAFSSLPHDFEKAPVEGFEEAFYVITPGKGLLEAEGMLGRESVDLAYPIRGGDLVAVPMGWHRVVALPNEDNNLPKFAYVWGYLAKYPSWEKGI